MRTTRLAFAAVVTVVLGTACSKPFGPGFEGEITMHTQKPGEAGKDMVLKTKADKIRFDAKGPTGDVAYSIYDPATNKVTVVMDAQKVFMDMDFSSPSAPKANTSADTSTAQKSGKHETIAGVDCEDWTATDASGKRTEVCMAPGVAFDLAALKGGGVSKETLANKLFPLRSVDYDAKGTEVSRTEVTKIEKKKLDDSLFVVPADYKKMDLPSALSPK